MKKISTENESRVGLSSLIVHRGTTGRKVCLAALLLACLLVCLLVSQRGAADSFRCGQNVVRVGDTEQAVVQRCGEPQRKDHGMVELWLDEASAASRVRVERWYYKPGSRKLERIVLLYRDRVVAVETGKR